ncbi:MAG TPA: hypothetical protein EYQ31_16090 [Candidatus Handelsmanbacteria bacterium]|nr:hypothetical protein [Candidatus Handelsmanbacteria bacterium]
MIVASRTYGIEIVWPTIPTRRAFTKDWNGVKMKAKNRKKPMKRAKEGRKIQAMIISPAEATAYSANATQIGK